MPQSTIVGVLRGGPSSEYDVSLQSGQTILGNMPSGFYPVDVLIDKQGVWHAQGLPKREEDILNQVDVVFNALHGEYGEDGQVQRVLERHGIPYTGSGVFASALAMNKAQSKEAFARAGLLVPESIIIARGDDVDTRVQSFFRSIGIPAVVKPNGAGSSIGVSIVRDFPTLLRSVETVLEKFNEVMIERYVTGKEITAGVLERFRGQDIYELLPVEIIPPDTCDFFDYTAKYTGITTERCPARLTSEVKAMIGNAARRAHEVVHARHYSRSDFILTPKGELYILELNTHPGLTKESLIPKPLAAIGTSMPQFVEHVLHLAMKKI